VAEGSKLWAPLAVTIAPLPLKAGQHYCWRLAIHHQSDEEWTVTFSVACDRSRMGSHAQ
jgi:hypothetical protein